MKSTKGQFEPEHINCAIPPRAHSPMYLMHKWWARKPHNVVAEYISCYTGKDEIVIDPFVGSGVSAIEAVRLRRKAVAIDLDPIATFITRMTLTKVDVEKYEEAFAAIRRAVKARIDELYVTECPKCKTRVPLVYAIISDKVRCSSCGRTSPLIKARKRGEDYLCSCGEKLNPDAVAGEEPVEVGYECDHCMKKAGTRVRFLIKREPKAIAFDRDWLEKIDNMDIPHWYPDARFYYDDGSPFKKKEHSESVTDLFTKRSLISLSILYDHILKIQDPIVKELMKLTFSSNLHNVSRLNPIHQPRWSKGEHPSTSWIVHSYWVPPFRVELPLWFYFEERFKHVLEGKKESNTLQFREARSFEDLEGHTNCLILTKSAVTLEEIPSSSIDFCFTDPPYGGSIQYLELSYMWSSWLAGPERDKCFQMNFADEITINDEQRKDFDYYHRMLRAAFAEVYRVLKPGRWLVVTFHNTDIKIYNSILKAVVLAGFDLEKVIYQPPARASAKGLFQPYGSAVGDYYIRFRKPITARGVLADAEIDKQRFERIVVETVKKIIASRGEPTAYSIIINSYPMIYEELKRDGYLFSAPEGIEDILKKHVKTEFVLVPVTDLTGGVVGKKWWLKEPGKIPYLTRVPLYERVEKAVVNVLYRKVETTFDDVLREIFTSFPNSLTPDTESVRQILSQYAEKTKRGMWRLRPDVKVRQGQHGNLVEVLCQLGEKCGFEVFGDIAGRRRTLALPIPKPNLDRIQEIDALWVQKNSIRYEFEVENTTSITEAIVRGSNIPYNLKRFIVIPKERENLLARKIEEPALRERVLNDGWNFIRYDDLLAFYNKVKNKKFIRPSELEKLSKAPVVKATRTASMNDFVRNDNPRVLHS